MKHCTIILVFAWLGLSLAFAQKGKIKDAVPAQKPDSVAEPIGKAAIRGALLMQEARDSLHISDLAAPSDVVDTFYVAPQSEPTRLFVTQKDLLNANFRIQDAKDQIEAAQKQLDIVKQEKKYSASRIEQAQIRLDAQKAVLASTVENYEALRSDWEAATGRKVLDEENEEVNELIPAPSPK